MHGTIRTLAPGTIRTAAFKIVKNPNGKATLTLNPNEFLDPATLQRDLAKYGIPAKVTSGSFCSSDPAPAGFSQVVSLPPRQAPVPPQSGVHPTITFDPAAMPAGTELSFGYFQLTSGGQQVSFALIDTSSYSCTSTPPGPAGPPDGSQLLYGDARARARRVLINKCRNGPLLPGAQTTPRAPVGPLPRSRMHVHRLPRRPASHSRRRAGAPQTVGLG